MHGITPRAPSQNDFFSSLLSLSNAFDKAYDRTPEHRVIDLRKGLDQGQAVRTRQKAVNVVGCIRFCGPTIMASWLWGLIEEEGNRNIENIAHLLQAARANAIGALFVFLHLLEGYAQLIGELFLISCLA